MKIEASEIFRILGVETRIQIIELLKSKGPLGVKKISEELGITPSAVSQHLKILRQAGLVRNERKGYWIPYSIDEERLEYCGCLVNEVCMCGCEKPSELKKQELDELNTEALLRYKKELEKELQRVQRIISRLKTRKSK